MHVCIQPALQIYFRQSRSSPLLLSVILNIQLHMCCHMVCIQIQFHLYMDVKNSTFHPQIHISHQKNSIRYLFFHDVVFSCAPLIILTWKTCSHKIGRIGNQTDHPPFLSVNQDLYISLTYCRLQVLNQLPFYA